MKTCENCGDDAAEDSNCCKECNKIKARMKVLNDKIRRCLKEVENAQWLLDNRRKNR